jgi:hypothetical protein
MNRAEREWAAALIVRTCQLQGDQWAHVGPKDLAKALEDESDANPIARTARNPFVPLPDFDDLVRKGFAEYHKPGWYNPPPVGFTQEGFRALRRWVTKPCPKCSLPSHCLWWANDPKSNAPVSGGWAVRSELCYTEDNGSYVKPIKPKMIEDNDFFSVWRICREVFECQHHGEFGLLDDGPPFFYEPDTYVLGPDGQKLFRM